MREKKCGIYMLTNKLTSDKYIGQSCDITRRIWEHKHHAKSGVNMGISKAIRKYGIENFEATILIECSKDELDAFEEKFISEIKPEYNTNGGGRKSYKCGRHLTDEEKEVCRQAAKKQWEDMSDEQKECVKKHQLIGPRKGHPVSEETREKLRQANLGKKQSAETIAKRAEKLQLIRWKQVRCVETGEVFLTIKSAADSIGFSATTLRTALKNSAKTCGGYHWEYVLQ